MSNWPPPVQAAVQEYLDAVQTLAEKSDDQSVLALAPPELTRLTGAVRALLVDHPANETGRCRTCTGRWFGRWRGCPVSTTLHRHLVAAGPSSSPGAGRQQDAPPHPAPARS